MGIEIPEYILKNLKKYGNAAIGERTFPSSITFRGIILKLKRLGFDCQIKAYPNDLFDSEQVKRRRKSSRTNYVIELIK